MTRIMTTKRVSRTGNSLGIHLTKELHALGLTVGDRVQITIEVAGETEPTPQDTEEADA